jgi:DNA-binding transcriptional ArsR family regulator
MEKTSALGALSALSQGSRLDVFRLLVAAGPEGMAAGAIAEQLDVVPGTLSFHLKLLTHAGLLEPQREGRSIRYTARFDTMNALIGFLTDNCCGGNPDACLPARSKASAAR